MAFDDSETCALLRDTQREALQLLREHIAMHRHQLERVAKINDRAEALPARAGSALEFIPWVAVPLAVLLLLRPWPTLPVRLP